LPGQFFPETPAPASAFGTGPAAALLDALPEPTCVVDGSGTLIAVNRAWIDSCLARGGDLSRAGVGSNHLDVCGEPGRQVATGLRAVLDGAQPSFVHAYPCHAPDASGWGSVHVHPLPGGGALVRHVDTTAQVQSLRALERAEQHDPLTDLLNRRQLTNRLGLALASAEPYSRTAVAVLGLDRFTRVNECLGHDAGDELLRAVAHRLAGGLLPGDVLARGDGDEFTLLRPRCAPGQDAVQIGEDLARRLQEPFRTATTSVSLTASTGVAVGQAPQTAEDLLAHADDARIDARRGGGGRTRAWSPQLRPRPIARLRQEEEVREGLDRGEFALHYQPVVDLRSRRVTGVEALVRWEHPDGLRMPAAFIPHAEQSGAIVPLGKWVLREACRQGAAWSRSGLQLDVAVNFSARQITHPDVITGLSEALTTTGMSAERLLVEVTESTLVEDTELAREAFAAIRALGARTAIDDFGTGYGSLLYLKRYPVSVLKVDRQFVAGLGSRKDDEAIVASVVSLARSVGAVCIAEGVETLEQYAALRRMGCESGQGYLLGRPVPSAQLPLSIVDCERLLADHEATTSPQAVPAAAVAVVRDLLAEGASLQTIAAALNRQGLRSTTGTRWHKASVARVVSTLRREHPVPGSYGAGRAAG